MTPSAMFGFNARAILAITAVLLATFFFALGPSPELSRNFEVDNDIRKALNTVFDVNELIEAEEKSNALESDLTGTFDTLPKNSLGRLTPRAVRHIVATYFGKEHGLFIKGLEPHGMQRAPCESLHEVSILRDRAPGFARALVEARQSEHGLSLEEVAAVIIVLEHLITDDHQDLLKTMYPVSNVSLADDLDVTTMKEVLKHYMLSLWHGSQNYSDPRAIQKLVQSSQEDGSIEDVILLVAEFIDKPAYINRDRANPFVPRLFNLEAASKVVRQLARSYGKWQDHSCDKMKRDLIKLDPNSSGRIPLASLYGSQDSTYSFFSESKIYLKELGALDLTDPENPEVIIPNYVQGPSNCVAPFPYYSICCLRECDVLISQIEGQIRTSSAEPEKVLNIARNLSTSTIEAPRKMQKKLVSKLQTIADHHGGQVPLHGRLFAQWMHYAFPWECPYPAYVNPDAWNANSWKDDVMTISAVDLVYYRELAVQLGKPQVSAATLQQWSDEEILPIEEVREPILPVILSVLWSFCRLAAQASLCLAMLRALWKGWQTLSRSRQQWREDQLCEDDFRKPRGKVDQRSRREAQRRRVIEQPNKHNAHVGQSASQRSPLVSSSNPGASVTTAADGNVSPDAIDGTSVSSAVEGDVSRDVSGHSGVASPDATGDASISRAVRETCAYCGHVGTDRKYVSTFCVAGCTTNIHKTCWRQRHGGFTLDRAPRRCTCGELLEHIEVYEHVGETEETRCVHTIQNGVVEEVQQPEVAAVPPAGQRKAEQQSRLQRRRAAEQLAAEQLAAEQQAEKRLEEAPALMPLVQNLAEEPLAKKPIALNAVPQSITDNLAEEPPVQSPAEHVASTAAPQGTAVNLAEEAPVQKPLEQAAPTAATQSTVENLTEEPPAPKPLEHVAFRAANQRTAVNLAEQPPAQKPVDTGKLEEVGDDRSSDGFPRFIAQSVATQPNATIHEQKSSKSKSYRLPPAPQGLPPPAPSSSPPFGPEMQPDQAAPPPGLEKPQTQSLPPPGLLLPHNLSSPPPPGLEIQQKLASLPPRPSSPPPPALEKPQWSSAPPLLGLEKPQWPSAPPPPGLEPPSLSPPGLCKPQSLSPPPAGFWMPQGPSALPPGLDRPQGAITAPPGLEKMRLPPGLFLGAESMTASPIFDAPPGLEDPKPAEKLKSSMDLFGTPADIGAEQQADDLLMTSSNSMLDESSAIAKAQNRWSKQKQADDAPRYAFRFQ